jgi:hypothetical protein
MRRLLACSLAAVLGGAAGCAPRAVGPPPPAAGPAAIPLAAIDFEPGEEEMTIDLALRGLSIGLLRLAVGRPGEIAGRRAVRVRSRVDSGGLLSLVRDLSWELETTLDLDRGLPIDERSRFAAEVRGARERGAESRQFGLDETLHNFHSLVMAIRGWSPAAGERAELAVRIEGRFRVTLALVDRRFDHGFDRPVLVVDGVAHFGGGHRFRLVISDDASRLPLRVDLESELGRFSAVLLRYRGPRGEYPPPRRLRGAFPG